MSTKMAVQVADTLGILPHLVEHHSLAEHPASYKVSRFKTSEAEDAPEQVRVTFNYEVPAGDGKFKKVTKTGVGETLDAAAADVRAAVMTPSKE